MGFEYLKLQQLKPPVIHILFNLNTSKFRELLTAIAAIRYQICGFKYCQNLFQSNFWPFSEPVLYVVILDVFALHSALLFKTVTCKIPPVDRANAIFVHFENVKLCFVGGFLAESLTRLLKYSLKVW